MHYLRMDGKETFKNAVNAMVSAAHEAMRRCEIDMTRIKCLIPHQANQRILMGVAHRLGLDEAKVVSTVAEHANTSAASIPLALATAMADGRVKRGDLLLMEAMGGGLTWGACAVRF
jgi:3-oxoacyl-[acyl-carrier-protein] synthase-3